MTSVRHPWTFLFTGVVASLLIAAISMPNNLNSVDTLASLLRSTGRYTFVLYLAIFLASPVHYLMQRKETAMWLRVRGGLGLFLAGNVLVHLGLIFTIFYVSAEPPQPKEVVIGGTVAMILVGLMALTSFKSVTDRLAKPIVKGIHQAGAGYLLFVVFFYDIVVSIFTKQPAGLYIALATLYYVALMLKGYVFLKKRKAHSIAKQANPAAAS